MAELPFKTEEWLISEILADRGEAVVLEPEDVGALIGGAQPSSKAELEQVEVRSRRPAASRRAPSACSRSSSSPSA